MKLYQCALALLLGLGGCAGPAAELGGPIHAFSACDRSFFVALKNNSQTLAPYLALTEDTGIAYPGFTGASPLDKTETKFKQPMLVNGVPLLAYDSIAAGTKSGQTVLFWGFVAKGAPDAVYAALAPLLATGHKIVRDGSTLGWTEARRVDDPPGQWTRQATASGTDPLPGTVEHGLMIEASDDPQWSGTTAIFCTVQGNLTPDLVQVYRPDITSEFRRRARQTNG